MRLSTHVTTPRHPHKLPFHWHWMLWGFIQISWWHTCDGHQMLHFSNALASPFFSRARTSRDELGAMGGHEGERGSGARTETGQCICKPKCSLVGDLRCVLQDFCSAHFWMSKPKRLLSQTSRCYLSVSVWNEATKRFSLHSPCLPICMFCRRPMQGWQLLRRSRKALVFAIL